MDKKALRKHYLAKRSDLSEKELLDYLDEILSFVHEQSVHFENKTIHLFLPIASKKELDTFPIIEALKVLNTRIVIPKSNFKDCSMEAIVFDETTDLSINPYDIPEPINGEIISPSEIDVIFIPMLIFDEMGYRVGYGKGFYDRFLTRCRPDIYKIGLCYFSAINHVSDTHSQDIPLDICISKNKVYTF